MLKALAELITGGSSFIDHTTYIISTKKNQKWSIYDTLSVDNRQTSSTKALEHFMRKGEVTSHINRRQPVFLL